MSKIKYNIHMWSLLDRIQWLILSQDLDSKLFLGQLTLPSGLHSTSLLVGSGDSDHGSPLFSVIFHLLNHSFGFASKRTSSFYFVEKLKNTTSYPTLVPLPLLFSNCQGSCSCFLRFFSTSGFISLCLKVSLNCVKY